MPIKTSLISLSLFIVLSFSYGQTPIITAENYFQIRNDYYRTLKFDVSLEMVTPGPAGEEVEWDFSSLDFAHPTVIIDTLSCIPPENTPFFDEEGTNYSLSNFCILVNTETFSPEDNNYFYYLNQNDSLQFIGNWANNGGNGLWFYSFSDFQTELVFPITYNDDYSDDFQSSYEDLSGGSKHFQIGSINVHADAYGTMITPNRDTIRNVLRIKEDIFYRDSTLLFGVENLSRHNFFWYAMGHKGPILQFTTRPGNDEEVLSAYYFEKVGGATATAETSKESPPLIYPNPSSGAFIVDLEYSSQSNLTLSVYDISGVLIDKRVHLNAGQIVLQSNDYSPGLYIIEVTNNGTLIGHSKLLIK